MKKHIKFLLYGLLTLTTFVPNVFADDSVLEKMKPLLEEDTFCVMHVDLTKLDTAAILNNNRAFVEKTFVDLGGSREQLEGFVKVLTHMPDDADFDATWQQMLGVVAGGKTMLTEMLGVREAFLVMGTGKPFPTFAYAAIPVTEQLNVEMIKGMIPEQSQVFVRKTDDYLFLTFVTHGPQSPESVQKFIDTCLGPKRPVARADFSAAYDTVKDCPVRILFAMPPYVKKIVAELRPGLPKQALEQAPALRQVDVPALVNGFRFEAIGIDLETGKLFAVTEAESELDAQVIVKQVDGLCGVLIDEFIKHLEELAQKKETSGRLLNPQEEILLSFYPEIFNRESLDRLKSDLLPQPEGRRLTVAWDRETAGERLTTSGIVLTKLIGIQVETAREAARRMQCANNMKQLGLAMHNYHDATGTFPPAFTVDENGKPLHSWRVLVLPYAERTALYESIRLDEPWDSEHNRQFHDHMPDYFRCPSCTLGDPKRDATYCMVVGEEAVGKTDGTGIKLSQMWDGTSNSIIFVERKTPVCWMAPEDVSFEDAIQGVNKIDTGIGAEHYQQDGVNTTFGDGSIHFISNEIDPAILRALLTIAGGESVPHGKF